MAWAERRRFVFLCGASASVAACNFISGAYDYEVTEEAVDTSRTERFDAGGGGKDSGRLEGNDAQAPDGGDVVPSGTKRVFVTSAYWYVGNVGGLDGADAHCLEAAKSAGRGDGPWRAWLSTQGTDARARIQHHGAYALVSGEVVASSWDELISGNLQRAIGITEKGTAVTGTILDSAVWTGTSFDGTRATLKPEESCQDFTSTSGVTGLVGSCFKSTQGEWTSFNAQSCMYWPAHLYCFEL